MRLILLLSLALIMLGCITPVQQLGCCLRDNATTNETTPGCVLYNTTTFQEHPEYMALTESCNATDGHCNVSLGGQYRLVPICTEDQLVPCVDPGCTAMVCGDFKYKPRVAPGFTTIEDSADDVPPDTGEAAALNFYKAQCRFLPMDAQLRQVMKNSKSQINVFRLGVGGSFDEFDQYRYYFPMSDKYCNVNPANMPGELRVDRYMNYLGWNPSTSKADDFDPADISDNCFEESDVDPPMRFPESAAGMSSFFIGTTASFSPVVPDKNNYNFAHHGRIDAWARYESDYDGYYSYDDYFFSPFSAYKSVDKEFYRRELSISHADQIYGLTSDETTRAAFECDLSKAECYSATCDVMTYSRGVLLGEGGLATGEEIVADCNKEADDYGNTRIVCAPTTTVTTSGSSVPDRHYAMVEVRPEHVEIFTQGIEFDDLAEEDSLDAWWDLFSVSTYAEVTGSSRQRENIQIPYYDIKARKNCGHDYSYNDDNKDQEVLCSHVQADGSEGPPAGGAVFVGKIGDTPMTWDGKTVIGWAIANSTAIDDMLVVKNCEMVEGVDYVKVQLDKSSDADWTKLIQTFKPYFRQRFAGVKRGGFDDGCGEYINALDVPISSMPWVLSHEKGIVDEAFIGAPDFELLAEHIDSPSALELRERNIYDEEMSLTPGVTSCDLRRGSLWWWFGGANFYYNMLFSRYIYLFTYTPDSNKIGKCAVDNSKYLPEMKTFGWCEPCTTSTLAYQNVTARSRVYMPAFAGKLESSSATNIEYICTSKFETDWSLWDGFTAEDSVSCQNAHITDIADYAGSIGGIGSPRTSPEASVMKERMGNYMKSGIMPVIDLSDDSNWNLDNPDAGDTTKIFWWTVEYGTPDYYMEYDFERLLGRMGASVVIVDHVSGVPSTTQRDAIIQRGNIVRQNCFGCLAAFHVDSPPDNVSFGQSITPITGYALGQNAIDVVTFDYPVSDHGWTTGSEVVSDLASYGRTSLRTPLPGQGKPVMVVGLNVESNDGTWSAANYDDLFDAFVEEQDELIRAGVFGVIYAPARDATSDRKGLVDVSGGIGQKSQKFCAMQEAMELMSRTPPSAIFSQILSANNVTCEPCTSLDLVTAGACTMLCDNGEPCTLPEDATGPTGYKCPANTVLDECDLCKDIPGTFTCNKTYVNGTVQAIGPLQMSELESPLYMDYIGGFEKPEKCCLEGGNATRYSYSKQAYGSAANKPVVIPKSGDPNVDCGMGDPGQVSKLTTFCNLDNVPLKDFDIICARS